MDQKRVLDQQLELLWLELTGKCQEKCVHCVTDSGPEGTHGIMTRGDWLRVIAEACDRNVRMIQFIGGEPTLHPSLRELIAHALRGGAKVEVFSNLVHVTEEMWEVFSEEGVSLATSWYSDHPAEHWLITDRPTFGPIKRNIAKALERGIPLRAGVIQVRSDQRVTQAIALLRRLGVATIGFDRVRTVGRAAGNNAPSVDALCGNCARGRLTIRPDGTANPCEFARWLAVGNVHEQSLGDILDGSVLASTRRELQSAFDLREGSAAHAAGCRPDLDCAPALQCKPDNTDCEPVNSPRLTAVGGATRAASGSYSERQLVLAGPPKRECSPDPCNPGNGCAPSHTCKPSNPCGPDNGCQPDL